MLNLLMKGLKAITNLPHGQDASRGCPLHWSAITLNGSDPFQRKKVSRAVPLLHLGGAQRLVTWLKSRENKALMSP
jgi:hypothetical protein